MKTEDVHFIPDKDMPKAPPNTMRDKLAAVFRTQHRAEDVADTILAAIDDAFKQRACRADGTCDCWQDGYDTGLDEPREP